MSTYLACRDILNINFCATVPNSTLTTYNLHFISIIFERKNVSRHFVELKTWEQSPVQFYIALWTILNFKKAQLKLAII